ncbi:SIR2 family NAD-dependent protein deacylase [Pseudomonas sp. Marseille-QA0892]
MTNRLEAIVERVRAAQSIVVFTGAGVSAESGIPTFREAQTGLWARFSPEELASPGAFREDPQRVWDWYAWRRQLCLEVEPNAGHRAVAALADRVQAFTLITQNVDGLHQRAGNKDVLELHGNIHGLRCFACGRPGGGWPEPPGEIVACDCGGLMRPTIVWFGESLPVNVLQQAEEAALQAEVLISVGTSSQVYPAAELPFIAKRHGAYIIEVNPHETPLSRTADACLQGPAGEWLPALVRALD